MVYCIFFKKKISNTTGFLKINFPCTFFRSLGGYESLAELPYLMTHASIEEKERVSLGVTDNLIRYKCCVVLGWYKKKLHLPPPHLVYSIT